MNRDELNGHINAILGAEEMLLSFRDWERDTGLEDAAADTLDVINELRAARDFLIDDVKRKLPEE